MAIDFGKVNISLRQFQEISSGKYNAGEVKLKSETEIGKVNNHVTMKFLNTTDISHVEVLAIKNAFVKALKSGGVKQEELDKVREKLGLKPMKLVDRTLHERSIKPLSRQQVREILDRYAIDINRHEGEGTIRTSDQIHAGVSTRKLESRRNDRNAANAELATRRDIVENKAINNLQAVLSGNVDFVPYDNRKDILAMARQCLDTILDRTQGNPSDVEKAAFQWTGPGGKTVVISSGLSEKALVRKLEDMIVRLVSDNPPSRRELAFRDEFAALATPEARASWVAKLTNDNDGACKARVVAVMIMHDRGIDDAATLSVVNQLSKDDAISFLTNLVSNGMDIEGDELRQSVAVQTALGCADPDLYVPSEESANIPALTADQFNEEIVSKMEHAPDLLPATFRNLVTGAVEEVRKRFGTFGYPADATPAMLTKGSNMRALIGVNDPNAPRITPEALRDGHMQEALRHCANRVFESGIERRMKASGVNHLLVATILRKHVPDIVEQILATQSPEAADAVLDKYKGLIDKAVETLLACNRCDKAIEGWAREAMAQKLGVPAASLSGKGILELGKLLTKAGKLEVAISKGEVKVEGADGVEAEYKKLVDAFVNERVQALAKVDSFDISAEAKTELKSLVLSLKSVDFLDFDGIASAAKEISANSNLAGLLAANAPKEQIFAEMGKIRSAVLDAMRNAFADDVKAGKVVGPDEQDSFTACMIAVIALSKPGMEADLVKFLSDNVADKPYVREEDVAFPAKQFMMMYDPYPGALAEKLFLTGNCAKSALAAGYHASELPRLAKAFALYKGATGVNDAAALLAVLDPTSKVSRLVGYGGRFMESVESFRAGLALMDRFATWYANVAQVVKSRNLNTLTKLNATMGYVPADALKGYEMFVFQDLAISPDVNLDEQDSEKLFGIEHNNAVNFFSRGNGNGCTGMLMGLSPAKRHVVYAAFKAIEAPVLQNPDNDMTNVNNAAWYLARILRNYDQVANLMATGNLDRAHLNKILAPDLELPDDATSQQVNDIIQDRMLEKYGVMLDKFSVASEYIRNGYTITEIIDAVDNGKKLAKLPEMPSSEMKIEAIDGTTNGGRELMLMDLSRPVQLTKVGSGERVPSDENNHFTVNIGGETIRCATGKPESNANIAEKIEAFCGKVHIEQANGVMRGLSQAAHIAITPILAQRGISTNQAEHMALTYTLTKDVATGAVTIRYSQPEGFPFVFSWSTTVALDGSATTTQVEIAPV